MILALNARYVRAGEAHFKPLTLPAARTAMLLVDVYYDDQQRGNWGDPADPFVRHFVWMERNIGAALDAARGAGLQVIYAMNSAPRIGLQHSAFGAHFARTWSKDASPDAFNREFAEGGVIDPLEYHRGRETRLKIPPSLAPREKDYYVRKHVYSAFFETRLDTALRNLHIETLVCAGLWANVCMAATALDALYRNYRVIWLRDGTLAGEGPEGASSLANTARWITWFEEIVGYTVTSTEFAAACGDSVDPVG